MPRVAPENQNPVLTGTCLIYRVATGTTMSNGTHKSSKTRPTQARLKQALSYDPATGLFTWIEPRRGRMLFSVAGHIDASTGYRDISIDDRSYHAAKLAWLYVFGEYPECVVDHINRNRADDRIENLRLATHSENIINSGVFSHNTSGFKGVYFYRNRAERGWPAWWAYITCNGTRKSLGYFHNKAEAVIARKEAEVNLFGEFSPMEIRNNDVVSAVHNPLVRL